MIHRAPFGSMERFIGVLIEHFAGNFPTWLAPEQVAILPISDKFLPYCEEIANKLKNSEIRTFVDERSEKIGKKIRDAEVKKVPFMLIIGEKEVDNQQVAVRRHGEGDRGTTDLSGFMAMINDELQVTAK